MEFYARSLKAETVQGGHDGGNGLSRGVHTRSTHVNPSEPGRPPR